MSSDRVFHKRDGEMIFGIDRFAENVAFQTDDGDRYRYSELVSTVDEFSKNLEVQKTLAICICENSVAFIAGYLAFLNTGIVPIMLGAQIDPSFIVGYIGEYRPRYLWKPRTLAISVPGFKLAASLNDYDLLVSCETVTLDLHSDLALLATTSGSTGSKKLVRQTLDNLSVNTSAITDSLHLDDNLSTITTLALNYTFGMSVLHTHLSVGSTIHLTSRSIMQKDFWLRMREGEVGILYGVPFTFEMLKKLKIHRQDLHHLRVLAQAGGKLSPELSAYFSSWCEEAKKKFYIMYGQAEATTRISCFCLNEHPEKGQSAGRPLKGGEIRIQSEKTVKSKNNVLGEIVYRGRNVCMGYAEGADDLVLGDTWCGELLTGDTGFVDDDGFVFVTGRKKRMVKLYGHSVSLDDIEALLNAEWPGQFICISCDEKVVVFYSEDQDTEVLARFLALNLKFQMKDFSFHRLGRVPRTESGKVSYHHLDVLYRSSLATEI